MSSSLSFSITMLSSALEVFFLNVHVISRTLLASILGRASRVSPLGQLGSIHFCRKSSVTSVNRVAEMSSPRHSLCSRPRHFFQYWSFRPLRLGVQTRRRPQLCCLNTPSILLRTSCLFSGSYQCSGHDFTGYFSRCRSAWIFCFPSFCCHLCVGLFQKQYLASSPIEIPLPSWSQ